MLNLLMAMARVAFVLITTCVFVPWIVSIGDSADSSEGNSFGLAVPGGDQEEGRVSRRKRYLNFPDGSTLNVVLCLTISPFMPRNWYTFGLTAGLGFPLPNSTAALVDLSPFPILRRRDRRDLYVRIEGLIDSHGLDGRSCLYRMLCEMSRRSGTHKGSFMEELLRILFTSPEGDGDAAEMGEHLNYDEANRAGRRGAEECSSIYSQCPFSILHSALDHFSAIDGASNSS